MRSYTRARSRQSGAITCAALGMAAAMMMVAVMAATPAQAASPDGYGPYPPPAHQQDVPPSGVQCNEPRELYLDGSRPLCLFPGTAETLMSRGIDLAKGPAQPPAAILGLTPEEEAWLAEHSVIRVAHDPGWFPIEYADEHGRIAGVTLHYIIKFEGLTGADLQPVLTDDWTGALEAIRERDADAIFMVAHTPERSEYMGFTSPHHFLETRLVAAEDRQMGLDEPGLGVITIRNYEIEDWLDENHPEVGYISVDSFEEGLALLRDGEADAFAATWPVVRAIAEQEGMTVYNAGPTGHSYPLSVGYRGDQPVLGSILQKALDASPPLLEIFEGSPGLMLTPGEKAWLAEHPVIRVAYDPGWFPIEYLDESGMLAGAAGGYMAEFERITGADFQQVPIDDWAHALESIRERDADVVFLAAETAARSEYMGFTTPHYTVESVLVTAQEMQLAMDEPGLQVITVRDYAIEDWLDENHPEVGYISVDSFEEGLALLRDGEADAFADVWRVVQAIAEQEGMTVYNAGPTGHSYDLSVGYRGDQPVLGSILQKALDSIPAYMLEKIQGE